MSCADRRLGYSQETQPAARHPARSEAQSQDDKVSDSSRTPGAGRRLGCSQETQPASRHPARSEAKSQDPRQGERCARGDPATSRRMTSSRAFLRERRAPAGAWGARKKHNRPAVILRGAKRSRRIHARASVAHGGGSCDFAQDDRSRVSSRTPGAGRRLGCSQEAEPARRHPARSEA